MDKIKNKVQVLVLQHPKEKKSALNSAKILSENLENCVVKTGLSWRNLKHALNDLPAANVNPKSWGVLYLGTKVSTKRARELSTKVSVIHKNGEVDANSEEILQQLRGIILIDGSWKESKTLWWRNAWLLKVHRLVVFPEKRSLYGELRKEPRRECLSTVESAAFTLRILENRQEIEEQLMGEFQKFLG